MKSPSSWMDTPSAPPMTFWRWVWTVVELAICLSLLSYLLWVLV